MAQELVKGKGYTYSADLWSDDICLYDFMIGTFPFGAELSDPYLIYNEILKKNLLFPITFDHYLSKSFLN